MHYYVESDSVNGRIYMIQVKCTNRGRAFNISRSPSWMNRGLISKNVVVNKNLYQHLYKFKTEGIIQESRHRMQQINWLIKLKLKS